MTEAGWHWRASVRLSRALCGPAGRPLCPRVYEACPARWRSVFMFVTDLLFAEFEHCRNVHRRWLFSSTRQSPAFS